MSLPKVRTWAFVAALVALQAPVMLAERGGGLPRNRPHVDRQVEQFSESSGGDTVRVLVQTSGDTNQLLWALRTKGIRVRRQLIRSGSFAIDIQASDLPWLERLEGVDSVSVDAPVFSSPLSPEAVFTYNGVGTTKKASDLRAQLGLTDYDP